MKYVIVLFLILNVGCFLDPAPDALDLKLDKPSTPSAISFSIKIDGDSFFYQNKKIMSDEIKELIVKFKKDNKQNHKIVMGIQPKSNAKTEKVVFLIDLARTENLEAVLTMED